ncbi:comEA protein [Erwinia sp. CPCC 100877]|nr:comEA protein [Erwinia sp. CPCC 100877]
MDYRAFVQKYWRHSVLGIVCIFVLIIGFFFFAQKEKSDPLEQAVQSQEYTAESQQLSQSQDQRIFLDIKGAVKQPGMYEGKENMRVWDAVMLAGGVIEEADTKQVNFSKRVTDQMVIYIPKAGEQLVETESTQLSNETEANKINLNQATEAQLQELSGVGQKKAQEIIRYREENGGFKTIEDLKNISGFGDKTFEKLKDNITV